MKIFKNGVWSKTQKPVYQVGTEQKDGSMLVHDATPMTKAEAEARLKELQPKKAKTPKKEKKAKTKKGK
jgi:hypothetical protein